MQEQPSRSFGQKCSSKKLCQIHKKTSLFNRVAGWRACNFIKKKLQHRCFPVNFAKYLGTAFFKKHHWWLCFCSTKKDGFHLFCGLHAALSNVELTLMYKGSIAAVENLKKIYLSNVWEFLARFQFSSLKMIYVDIIT